MNDAAKAAPVRALVDRGEIYESPGLPEKWDSARGYVEGWNAHRAELEAALARELNERTPAVTEQAGVNPDWHAFVCEFVGPGAMRELQRRYEEQFSQL